MTFTPRLKATTDVAQVRIKIVLSRNSEYNLNLSILSLTQFFCSFSLLVKQTNDFSQSRGV